MQRYKLECYKNKRSKSVGEEFALKHRVMEVEIDKEKPR